MAAGTLSNNRRNATEVERSLAVPLISGALALIIAVLWSAFGIFDKVSHLGQTIVAVSGIIGCVLLVGSIVLGGLGIAYGTIPGNWNRFDLQAKMGILALIILFSAPLTAYFTWKPPNANIYEELNHVRRALFDVEANIKTRLDAVDQTVGSNRNETSLLRQEINALKGQVDLIRQGEGKGDEQEEHNLQ